MVHQVHPLDVHVQDPGYGPGVEPADPDTAEVDTGAEGVPWAAVSPRGAPGEAELVFIDGVQRIEAWLTASVPDEPWPITGAAFAVGVGAVRAGIARRAMVERVAVERYAISTGDRPIQLPGFGSFRWRALSGAPEREGALYALVNEHRRRLERRLTEEMGGEDRLVLVDGPLPRSAELTGPVAGIVKSHHARYLAGPEAELVPRLAIGQRTPLFAIGADRLSWYQRLPGADGWGGVLRGELPRALGLVRAREAADRATLELPRFAGREHRDPRAPRNLAPINGLETRLRHRLGDRRLALRAVRRAAAHATIESATVTVLAFEATLEEAAAA
jgi:hypothetical protein